MYGRFYKVLLIILLTSVSFSTAQVLEDVRILGIRVDFPIDEYAGTTGNGKFILSDNYLFCNQYTIES